ncbi:zinc finger, CCHC-type containing protein [Tanacetum coccineum]
MESRKMQGLKENNDDAKVYLVDGKSLKSILKKSRVSRMADSMNTKESPLRKVSMSLIVSVQEFDIETSDIHDDGVAKAAPVGNTNAGATGIKQKMLDYGVGRASPTYADVVENRSRPNDGTTLFGPNHIDGIHTIENEDIMGSVESVARVSKPDVPKMLNFRSLVNEEKVDNADFVLPRDAMVKVKRNFENSLVGYFIGKILAFQIVQNYVTNTWSKFGFEKVMKNDDGIFLFKFADSMGMDQVMDRGPWLIHNTPLILNKWTPSLPLKKDVVTKVPIWVKLHKVPLVAYSEDGLSLIATQIRKPVMLDAYTSFMCGDAWGRINFARDLIEVSLDSDLKKEVTMTVSNEDETSYTREVISMEYEWKPPRCADCKIFGHSSDRCPKIVRDPVSTDINSDEFTEVKRKKHKGKKTDTQPRRGADMDPTTKRSAINKVNGPSTSNSFDALNTMDVEDECGTSRSKDNQVEECKLGCNDHVESDDEVDEFIFPKGDKVGLSSAVLGNDDLLETIESSYSARIRVREVIVKEMTTNFMKLDKFEGHDIRQWQKKMHFLLMTLKVVYVLTTPMPELLEDDTAEAIRRRAKWENDDYICRGHILNEDASSKKFLVSNFNNYKMVDSRPVMEQFNELLRILGQYTQHGLKMDESVYVLSVIDKWPPSWNDFKHSLKHDKDDLSLVQLGSHLRIDESLRAHESDKGKGKKVVGPFVNMIKEGGMNKNNKQNKGKKCGYKENNSGSGFNKKPKLECWKCGQTGHFKKDCHSGNKKNNTNAGGSGKGSKDQSQDQGFGYYNNGMFMLNLNKVPNDSGSVYMSSFTVVNSSLWHARSRHAFEPKRKTLGEKGIDCIFVGYAEHSKAYRFYVIEPNYSVSINSIIESRDAIFKENRFSSIPMPKDIIPNSDGSQRDDHLNDVPSETLEPRRGKRARKAKSYGFDFQLYLTEGSRDQIGSQYSYYYSMEENHRIYNEAMQS